MVLNDPHMNCIITDIGLHCIGDCKYKYFYDHHLWCADCLINTELDVVDKLREPINQLEEDNDAALEAVEQLEIELQEITELLDDD